MTSDSTRLSGLSSGIDTESVITSLLAVKQAQIDKLEDEKELSSAKTDTWTDISEQFKTFANAIKVLRADSTGSNTLWDNKSVVNADETSATVVAASNAVNATYLVDIDKLAQATVIHGDQNAGYTTSSAGSFVLNTKTISYSSGDSLIDLANLINSTTFDSGDDITATVIDDRLVLQTETGLDGVSARTITTTSPDILGDAGSGLGLFDTDSPYTILNQVQTSDESEVVINGITVNTNSNTLSDVITGVTMSLHATTASNFNITIGHDTEGIKEAINDFIDSYNETRSQLKRVREIKLDEEDQFGPFFSDSLLNSLIQNTRALSSGSVNLGNYDTWDGESVTINANASEGDETVDLDFSTSKTVSAGTIFQIEGHTSLYTVTTDATGDPATVSVSPPLEGALTAGAAVNTVFSLESFGIGIKSDTVSSLEGVLAVLDEAKLDATLATNPYILRDMFKKTDSNSNATDGFNGVAERLYDWIDTQTKISFFTSKTRSIDDTKLDALASNVVSIDKQIETLKKRMEAEETTLVRQFAQMENAIASSNSSSSQLANLAAGGG
jgi:flagellar capping protein FliD